LLFGSQLLLLQLPEAQSDEREQSAPSGSLLELLFEG
jgi:hypothetical protein